MKKKAQKRKLHPSTGKIRKYFYDQYQAVKGRPYNPSFQKDAMIMHHLLNRYPETWIMGMIDYYLRWGDQFVKDCGYTTGIFYTKINQMLEMNIHRSNHVHRHEVKMKTEKEVLNKIAPGGSDAKIKTIKAEGE